MLGFAGQWLCIELTRTATEWRCQDWQRHGNASHRTETQGKSCEPTGSAKAMHGTDRQRQGRESKRPARQGKEKEMSGNASLSKGKAE
jgi:hypothetical protein